jgi:hypothetical protein
VESTIFNVPICAGTSKYEEPIVLIFFGIKKLLLPRNAISIGKIINKSPAQSEYFFIVLIKVSVSLIFSDLSSSHRSTTMKFQEFLG